jgi:hypothetical protein
MPKIDLRMRPIPRKASLAILGRRFKCAAYSGAGLRLSERAVDAG